MSIAYGTADADSARASRASVLISPDGKIAKAYAAVKPADHPDEVLADLKSLA
jgi:peroxiredoxin